MLNHHRKLIVLLLALLILSLLLAACKGEKKKQQPSEPSEHVTITFGCREWEKSTYRDLADQFEAANPDVRVHLVMLEATADPTDSVAEADTLIMSPYPTLTRQGLVRDLTPFIEADKTFEPEYFYPHTLEDLQWDGGAWGLPFAVSFHLIFYDKEAFDAAGVPYPEPGWTWDDFLSKAKALTEREGDEVVRWGFVWRLRDPLPFIQGRAGPLVDTSAEPPDPLLDRPEVAEAVHWLADLALVHQVMPYLEPEQSGPTGSEAARLVGGGRAAMWSETTQLWAQQSPGRSLGMVPFPVDEPTSATTPVVLSSYAMSAGTAHPQESWRWLAFLSRQAVGRDLPARRSVAEQSGYWEGLDDEVAATYRFALEHGFSRAQSGWGWVGWGLHDALEAVLGEEQEVEKALAQVQATAYGHIEDELAEDAAAAPFAVATPEPVSDEGLSIVFRLIGASLERQAVYEALADRFHELHPEITVEIHQPGGESDPETLAAQGDCFRWILSGKKEVEWWSEAILSLDPFLEADASFPGDDFYPQFMNAVRWEGQLWGLPFEGYPQLMRYNQALFDTAGLAYPAPNWTLDDFQRLAVALTQGEGKSKVYGYLPSLLGNPEPLFFLEQWGAPLVDEDAGTYGFDDPATVEALQWYADLIRRGVMPLEFVQYNPAEGSLQSRQEVARQFRMLIEAGKAAMWSEGYGMGVPWLSDFAGLEIGMVPMPQGPGRVGNFRLNAHFISAQTEHPQACWEWLKFLSEQVAIVQGVPARRSLAESEAYRWQVGEELAAVYLASLEQTERLFTSAQHFYPRGKSYIGRRLWSILEAIEEGEDVDVELMLDEAQHKVEQFIQCLETQGSHEDERELIHTCINRIEGLGP